MAQLFLNNARGVLAESVSSGETLLKVRDHAGIPSSLAGGEYFLLTLFLDTTRYGSNLEVVKVTAVTAGSGGQLNLTVVRGFEYPARIHNAGARLEARLTAQTLRDLVSDYQAYADQVITDHEESYDPHEQYVRKDIEAIKKTATLDLDFASGDYALDDGEKLRTTNAGEVLTVERATPKWVFGPNGKLREVPANTLARQWNPETGEPEGVLIEESRTNLLLWSEDLTQEAWITGFASVEVTAEPAPNGVPLVQKIVPNTVSTLFHRVEQNAPVTEGKEYVLSVYLKPAGFSYATIRFNSDFVGGTLYAGVDLNTGSCTDVQNSGNVMYAEPVGGGWVKVVVVAVAAVTGMTSGAYITPRPNDSYRSTFEGDGESGIYIWGAQLEEASTPSSYIPTEDAPVTRAADNVSRVLGEEFNPSEGTWVFELRDLQGFPYFSIDDGSIVNRIQFFFRPTDDAVRLVAWASGNSLLFENIGLIARDGKYAVSWSKSGWAASINGQAYQGALGEVPVGLSWLRFSQGQGGTTVGRVKVDNSSYIPRALSEAELIELTS